MIIHQRCIMINNKLFIRINKMSRRLIGKSPRFELGVYMFKSYRLRALVA